MYDWREYPVRFRLRNLPTQQWVDVCKHLPTQQAFDDKDLRLRSVGRPSALRHKPAGAWCHSLAKWCQKKVPTTNYRCASVYIYGRNAILGPRAGKRTYVLRTPTLIQILVGFSSTGSACSGPQMACHGLAVEMYGGVQPRPRSTASRCCSMSF